MKSLLVSFVVLCSFLNVFAQKEQYRYLKIQDEEGDAWISVCERPCDSDYTGETIKTLSFQKFAEAKVGLTKSEGFELAFELEHWRDLSPLSGSLCNIQIKEDVLRKVISVFANHLYHKKPEDLNRQETLFLWLKVTRALFFHYNREAPLNFQQRSRDAAILGEMVWELMPENLSVCDVKVFSLHNPKWMSVNLLLDCGGNIMTKVTVIPDLYFKENFSLAMLEKSSKNLKKFGASEYHKNKK
jgi:hypothetical protein